MDRTPICADFPWWTKVSRYPTALLQEAHLTWRYYHCFAFQETLVENWLSAIWKTTDFEGTDWLLRQILHSAAWEIEAIWAHRGFDDDAIEAKLKIRIRKVRAQSFDPHMLHQHCSSTFPSPQLAMRI